MARRILALDITKLLLACAVVGIHAELGKDIAPDMGTFLVDFVFRLAVPVFFLIGGYFLARSLSAGQSLGRWAIGVILMYVIWTSFYWPDISALAAASDNPPAWLALLLLQGYFQLWYVPALLIGGLLLRATRGLSTRNLLLVAVGLYLVGVGLQYLAALKLLPAGLYPGHAEEFLYRNGLFFGFPMMALGALIERAGTKLPAATGRNALLLGLVLMVAEFGLNRLAGITESFEMGLFVPVLASGLFLLLYRRPVREVPALIADLPSAIYFTHVLVLGHLFRTVGPSPLRWGLTLAACAIVALPLSFLHRLMLKRTGFGLL